MPATQWTGLSHFRLNQIPETYQQKRLGIPGSLQYISDKLWLTKTTKNMSFFFALFQGIYLNRLHLLFGLYTSLLDFFCCFLAFFATNSLQRHQNHDDVEQ